MSNFSKTVLVLLIVFLVVYVAQQHSLAQSILKNERLKLQNEHFMLLNRVMQTHASYAELGNESEREPMGFKIANSEN